MRSKHSFMHFGRGQGRKVTIGSELMRTLGARALAATVLAIIGIGGASGADKSRLTNKREPARNASARVGVALISEGKQILVHFVVPETPAARSGKIHRRDRLISVAQGDGRPVAAKGVSLADAAALIRGPKGTVVTLSLVPEGKEDKDAITVPLTRGEFDELSHFGDGRFPTAGTEAPELKAESLLPGGPDYKLPPKPGHVVVVLFWAGWYPLSISQIETLQKLRDQYPEWKDEVELIAVAVDEKKPAAQSLVAKGHKRDDILKVWAGQGVLKPFHIDVLPAIWIFDAQGKVLAANHSLDIPKALRKRPTGPPAASPTPSSKSTPSPASKEKSGD
jgi:hypothetical protein